MAEFETKFSGKKDEYGTGATRDCREGKGRYDLIPGEPIRRLAGVYERGAKNHGDRNWEKGIPFSRCLDSALRHLNQYAEIKRMGLEMDEDHAAQCMWNICALMHFEKYRPDLDDLSPKEVSTDNYNPGMLVFFTPEEIEFMKETLIYTQWNAASGYPREHMAAQIRAKFDVKSTER
jgi:hypothetical protein